MKNIVYKNEIGERADKFLAQEFSESSRSYFEKLILDKRVLVNGKTIKANQILKFNDRITIDFLVKTQLKDPQGEDISLDIIFEDENVIVINKPAGLVVHPAAGHADNTLINALLNHFPKISEAVYDKDNPLSRMRPGLVHRLDKDTSGIMIVAKNERTMHSLSKQIQNRTVKKIYVGLCYGWPKKEEGIMRSFLGRHSKNRKKIAEIAEDKGKEAITNYRVIQNYTFNKEKVSLVEFDIKTGRTHQIRVQISSLGHPILGDNFYGNRLSEKLSISLDIRRQLLHAKELTISLPGESRAKTFEAPMPEDFKLILKQIK
jgi:23S rRNA pseudouridine1911/1915/1917 synthase